MRQCYKDAVAHFRDHPGEIVEAWHKTWLHPHGVLFRFCTPDGHPVPGGTIGCPLQVAKRGYSAWTPELEERIRSLDLPDGPELLEDRHLVTLARVQDLMDDTIRNPEWLREHRYASPFGEGASTGGAEDDNED
jgi:hypothetical protein